MPRRKVCVPAVGIVTEGRGEVLSLPSLYAQLESSCAIKLVKPLFADVDPQSPVPLLCRVLSRSVRQSVGRGADHVVVLLDSERSDICPGERAVEIAGRLSKDVEEPVSVVLKHTTFENWLIADANAFIAQPGLFPEAKRINISAGCADNVNAKRLIESALGARRFYSKTDHPCKILNRSHIRAMRRYSPSFDKFVRTLEAA